MRRTRHAAWVLTSLAFMACTGDGRLPTQPTIGSSGSANSSISDGANGGTAGFYFMPPMVKNPHGTGTADASLAPRVEICELAGSACGPLVATLVTGSGPDDIHAGEVYTANWKNTTALDPAKFYRVSVLVGVTRLGSIDVDVVMTQKEAKSVNDALYLALVRGGHLGIHFRIERGIAGTVTLTPAPASVVVGATQLLTASVTDLHGTVLPSASVTWSTGNPSIATVSATGLVTGVAVGSTTITATSGAASGTSVVTVIAANQPPTSSNDAYTAVEGVALSVAAPGVLANDGDPDGNPITASLVSGPSHGALTLNADGSFTYTATVGFSGTDSFSYTANDASLASPAATVTLTVAAANHPPQAAADAYAATEDQVLTIAANGVLANDTDPDGNTVSALAASIVTAHGAVELHADGSFTYTPSANYHGTDSFTYQATDGSLTSGPTTVTLTVASVNDAPVAAPDAFTAQEDVPFSAPVPGVLANDTDVDGDALSAVAGTATSVHGGTVVIAADGSFTYTGAANFNGTDSFTYQVTDGTVTASATVTMTVTAVNDAPVALADSYQAIGNVAITIPAPGVLANDTDVDGGTIAATPGSYSTASGGSVTMNADGSFTYVSAPGFTGTDSFTYTATDGSAPSAPATVIVTSPTRVWYVRNDATAPGDGRQTSPFATLQAAQAASLDNETIYVLAGDGTTTGLDQGILLQTGQSLVGQGIPASVTTVLNGQTVTLLAAGSPASLTNGGAPATITLAAGNTVRGLRVLAQGGAGFSGSGFGSLTVSAVSVNASVGAALSLQNGVVNASFSDVTSSNSPGAGIALNNLAGSLTATSGRLRSAGVSAFTVNGGQANITYGGSIVTDTGRSVSITGRTAGAIVLTDSVHDAGNGILIQNNTGGSVQFAGTVTRAETHAPVAVSLLNNAGSTVTFSGGNLVVHNTAGSGLVASGGGTLVVSGPGNAIDATGGAALVVQNTTIGATGLRFQSLSATGGANGIMLSGTGTLGGLTVTGTGAPGSGGTIAGITGPDGATSGTGVYLSATRNVSLGGMNLHDFSNFAVFGSGITGFAMDGSTISGVNGTSAALHEGSLVFSELAGSASITGTTVSGGYFNNLRVENASALLNRLTITNSAFGANDAANGGDGVALLGASPTFNATVQSSQFTAARQQLFVVDIQGTTHSDIVLAGSSFSNNHPAIISGAGGVQLGIRGTSSALTYSVTGNSFRDASGNALVVVKGSGTSVASGTIANNTVGVSGVPNSGSAQGSALALTNVGGGSHAVVVMNNQLAQYNNRGVLLQIGDASQGGSGSLDATVTGNVISNPGTAAFAKNGILATIGTAGGDAHQACLAISGNTIAGSGAGGPAGTDLRFNERFLTAIRLPGYAGANNDNAAVQALLQSLNGGAPTVLANNNVSVGGAGYAGSGGCVTP